MRASSRPLWGVDLVRAAVEDYQAGLARQLYAFERLTLGYHPTRLHSERWFAPWWPYRAARKLKSMKAEASHRLSFALDVLQHGHDCD